LAKEGFSQLSENVGQLKMAAPDGKEYMTDAARKNFESPLGQSVVSQSNFLPKKGHQGKLPQPD